MEKIIKVLIKHFLTENPESVYYNEEAATFVNNC